MKLHMPPKFRDTKAYDLLIVSPIVAFYLFATAGLAIELVPQFRALAEHFRWPEALEVFSRALALVFFGVQIALFLARRVPKMRSDTVLPNVTAVAGANVAALFLLLRPAHLTPALSLVSSGLTALGTLGAIFTALWLDRAFAILPQARVLVTRGPYRHIRHPLYLFEMIATAGVSMLFAQPGSAAVLLVVFALQLARMHYEEEVLTKAFPEYAAYRARTARLIPGIY